MKKYLPFLILSLAVLACSLPVAVTALPPATVPAGATYLPVTGPGGSGAFNLTILSPLDGSVLNASKVEIVGLAPAGTVISINDDFLIVGADGQFKHVVTLQEGPNVIEILASDAQGNEVYLPLSLFYEP